MKYNKSILIFIITVVVLANNLVAQNRFCKIKIADGLKVINASDSVLPANFLQRVKNAGYTHVGVWVGVNESEWDNGTYQFPAHGERERLTSLFLSAHAAGLKVIPMLPSGNLVSAQWCKIKSKKITYEPYANKLYENQAMNTALSKNFILRLASKLLGAKNESELKLSTVPSYADDSSGFSESYTSLLRDVVLASFRNTGLNDSEFTYIHICNDEPIIYDFTVDTLQKCLIGNSQEDLKWMYNRDTVNHFGVTILNDSIGGTNFQNLRDSLKNLRNSDAQYGKMWVSDSCIYVPPEDSNYQKGRRALYADWIQRRVQEIETLMPNKKVLIFGEMSDPQHTGGYLHTAAMLDSLALMNVTVNGISTRINKFLVLAPWLYTNTYTHPLEGNLDNATVTGTSTVVQHLSIGWLACDAAFPPPFLHNIVLRKVCKAGIAEYTYDDIPNIISGDITLALNAQGHYYHADSTINHIIRNGFQYMPCLAFEKGEMVSHTLYQNTKVIEASKNLPTGLRDSFCLGFAFSAYAGDDWNDSNNMYDQSQVFNDLEYLSATAQTDTINGTIMHMNRMNSVASLGLGISRTPVTAIDYLITNKNYYDPHCAVVNKTRDSVSFYDAIYFCNNLSKREGLDTVYRYSSVDYNDQFDVGKPQILSMQNLTEDSIANGYKLPRWSNLHAIKTDTSFVKDSTIREWIWSGDTANILQAYRFKSIDTAQHMQANMTCAFRVVRNTGRIPNLLVFSKEEALSSAISSNPRIYLQNNSTVQISKFTVHYFFTTENSKTPMVSPYWIPGSVVTLHQMNDSLYDVQYYFAGQLANGGVILPDPAGNVVGIHYTDWSNLNKSNDYSFNNSATFLKNEKIVVTDSNGIIIYGYMPATTGSGGSTTPPTPHDTLVGSVAITGSGTYPVTTAGVTFRYNDVSFHHGMMFTVRNTGLNDSVQVEWTGVRDQNLTNCQAQSANLFGNGAQINNICTSREVDGDMYVTISAHSACNVQIEIYDWVNGAGCP